MSRRADPFSPLADPRRYVPRPATEEALTTLAHQLRAGARVCALTGPPGIGKTMLLAVLADRLVGELRFVPLPYPALSAPELCRWVLDELAQTPGDDPERELAVRAVAQSRNGRPLVLALDDAHALPDETAAGLSTLAVAAGGALRLVVAATAGAGFERVLARLEPDSRPVRLDAPMSREELGEYVPARLASVEADAVLRARFGEAALDRLHRGSGGVPALVHHGATRLLRAGEPAATSAAGPPARNDAAEAEATQVEEERSEPEATHEQSPQRRRSGLGLALAGIALVALVGIAAALVLVAGTGDLPPPRAPSAGLPARGVPTTTAGTGSSAGEMPVIVQQDGPLEPPAPPAPEPATPADVADPSVAVHINATPWAEIEIDGLRVGVTPLGGVVLLPGRHEVRARMADGRERVRHVDVRGEQEHLVFE